MLCAQPRPAEGNTGKDGSAAWLPDVGLLPVVVRPPSHAFVDRADAPVLQLDLGHVSRGLAGQVRGERAWDHPVRDEVASGGPRLLPGHSAVDVALFLERDDKAKRVDLAAAMLRNELAPPPGGQGQGAGALLRRPLLSCRGAIREAPDRKSALGVAEVDASAKKR